MLNDFVQKNNKMPVSNILGLLSRNTKNLRNTNAGTQEKKF